MRSEFAFEAGQLNIRINYLFFAAVPLMYMAGFIKEFVLCFICILLHEAGHIITAFILGKRVFSVSILPVGLNAQIQEENFNRRTQLLIYASGPAVNILLFLAGLMINSYYLLQSDNMRFFISINAYLALFNMVPVLPLDGGRILRGILTGRVGLIQAGKYARKISMLLSGVLLVLGVVQIVGSIYNFSLIILSTYIFFTIKSEDMEAALMNVKDIIYRRSRLLKKGIYQARDLVVIKSVCLSEVLKNMDFDRFHIVYVLDDDLKIMKVFTEQEVIDGMFNNNSDMTFEEFVAKTKI